MDAKTARVVPFTETRARGIPASVEKMLSNAEKLGGWLSDLSLFEVSSTLKVGF